MLGDIKETSGTRVAAPITDMDPLKPLTDATEKGWKALLNAILANGTEIIRLDVGAAPIPQSQHVRYRVTQIIFNALTAQTMTLTIGTSQYPIDVAARGTVSIVFPLVIERGSDMSCIGIDGRVYMIGLPE